MLVRVELWFVDPAYPDFLSLQAGDPYNDDSRSSFHYSRPFLFVLTYLPLTTITYVHTNKWSYKRPLNMDIIKNT